MATQNITKLVIPNGENQAVLDIGQIQSDINTDVTEINNRLDALESGSRQLALKDYALEENQAEMVPLVYYSVPYTADGTFVQLGENGKPVGDAVIDHFDIYMKSEDGTVTKVTTQYTASNLQGVAYTNKKATFEAGIAKSATSDYASLADTDLIAKDEIAPKVSEIEGDITNLESAVTNITNGTTPITLPDATDSAKGVVTLSDATDGTENAATGKKAATPKAVADAKAAVTAELKKVTDVIGTNAENAALTNAANTFTQANTFTNTADGTPVKIKLTDVTASANPGTNAAANITFTDSANAELGVVGYSKGTDGVERMYITNTAHEGDEPTPEIVLQRNADGTSEVHVPTPKASASGDEVVTAKWVQDNISTVIPEVNDASESQKGIIQIASQAEVTAGTDTTKAVTPKYLKTELDKKVALDSDNNFTGNNTFTTGGSSLTLNGEGISGPADSDLHLGAGTTEVVISSDGHITRPAMPSDAGETEVVTKKYVDDKVSTATIPNATETTAGKVELATTAEATAGTDTQRAVTPAGLKSALNLKIQVITDIGQATQDNVLYIVTD